MRRRRGTDRARAWFAGFAFPVGVIAWVGSCATPEPGLPGGSQVVAERVVTIDFLDVGQGDAVLIRSPEGHTVVYDGGPDPSRVARLLEVEGVDHVDLVIASHNHADHIGGLAEVMERFSPRYFMDNGLPHTTRTYERLLRAVQDSGAQLLEATPRTIEMGSVALRIVPPPGRASWGQNENSVAVMIEMGQFRALLAGDAEPRLWAWWLEHHTDALRPVHVLKASHHGSRHGDTSEALDRLRPGVVVIGVAAGNPYGHPHEEALARYREVGARVFRTDMEGTIRIEATGAGEVRVIRRADRAWGSPRTGSFSRVPLH